MGRVIIRRFEPEDRERVRELCLARSPIRPFFEDEEVIRTFAADYYLDREPELCLVAEVDDQVVGYVMGGTAQGRGRWLVRVIPRVALRIAWKLMSLQYRSRRTYQFLWYAFGRSWRRGPAVKLPLDRYPVDCHLNVDEERENFRAGPKLIAAFIDHLKARGIAGMRGGVWEEEGHEVWSKYLCRKLGGRVLTTMPFPLLNTFTDKTWVLRIVVRDLRMKDENRR